MDEQRMRTGSVLARKEDCILVVIDVQEKLVPVIAGGGRSDSKHHKACKVCQDC